MKLLNLAKSFSLLNLKNAINSTNSPNSYFNYTSIRSNSYKGANLWNSVLSVSSQGARKGRGKGRAGSSKKNLNIGQELGIGKLKVEWPGLNAPLTTNNKLSEIKVIGEDTNRDLRLQELRSQMDKFRRITIAPHERGWSGGIMEGKSVGLPLDPETDVQINQTGFDTRILLYCVKSQQASILGKKKRSLCIVVTGNKNGVIGLGKATGSNAQTAIRLAKKCAAKRLIQIDLLENRTLFHTFYQEYYYTKLYCESKPAGYGIKAHRIIHTICKLVGIKDIHVRLTGSNNVLNMCKAFINGLLKQKKYEEIANKKNLHVVEMRSERRNYPVILASPADSKVRHKDELEHEYEKNMNLYILDNKTRLKPVKRKPFFVHYPSYRVYCAKRDKFKAQKIAKWNRMSSLPDDILESVSYPKKAKPKKINAEGEEEGEAAVA